MAVLNKKISGIPAGAVYIGRGSKWGNPFVIGKHGTRDEVCDRHLAHLEEQVSKGEVTVEELISLHGKDLVCFCAPLRCHGDNIELAIEWARSQK